MHTIYMTIIKIHWFEPVHCTANRENEFADFIPCFGSSFSKKENCLITFFFFTFTGPCLRRGWACGRWWRLAGAPWGRARPGPFWQPRPPRSRTPRSQVRFHSGLKVLLLLLRPFGFLGFCGRRRVLACLVFILFLFKVIFSNKQTKKKRPPHLQ